MLFRVPTCRLSNHVKLVSSAIASSLSIVTVNAVADENVVKLETIHQEVKAEQTPSLKVDNSANKNLLHPYWIHLNLYQSFLNN